MTEATEFLILDTIKRHSSIMPLFSAGYSYSKVIEWVHQLENEGKICYGEMEQRILSVEGTERWRDIKNKKKEYMILPLVNYRVDKIDVDEIYLP